MRVGGRDGGALSHFGQASGLLGLRRRELEAEAEEFGFLGRGCRFGRFWASFIVHWWSRFVGVDVNLGSDTKYQKEAIMNLVYSYTYNTEKRGKVKKRATLMGLWGKSVVPFPWE